MKKIIAVKKENPTEYFREICKAVEIGLKLYLSCMVLFYFYQMVSSPEESKEEAFVYGKNLAACPKLSPIEEWIQSITAFFKPGLFMMVCLESLYRMMKSLNVAIEKNSQIELEDKILEKKIKNGLSGFKTNTHFRFQSYLYPTAVLSKATYRFLNQEVLQVWAKKICLRVGLPQGADTAMVFAGLTFIDMFQSVIIETSILKKVENELKLEIELLERGYQENVEESCARIAIQKIINSLKEGTCPDKKLQELYRLKENSIIDNWASLGSRRWVELCKNEAAKDLTFVLTYQVLQRVLDYSGITKASPLLGSVIEAFIATTVSTPFNNAVRILVQNPEDFIKTKISPKLKTVIKKRELTKEDQGFIMALRIVLSGNPLENLSTRIKCVAIPRAAYAVYRNIEEIQKIFFNETSVLRS